MPTVRCPSCGSTDDLTGTDAAEGKIVACGACGHRWQRDLRPTCQLCGSRDLEAVPTATLEEAGRGVMRTPSGIRDVYRCFGCGARDATASSPVPAEPGWRDRARRGVTVPRELQDVTASARGQESGVESEFGRFAVGEVVGGRWRLTGCRRWAPPTSLWEATEVDGPRTAVFKLYAPRPRDELGAKVRAAAAQAVSGVSHPHLLRIHDVQRRRQHALIVAEAVPGPTLTDAQLSPDELRHVAATCSDALAALHEHGLAHLDIGPDKILVPTSAAARLVSFGSGLARQRLRTGMPGDDDLRWFAPEQAISDQHHMAADVYSLALSLWVAAGGQLERLGATTAAQIRTRLQHDLPALDDTSEIPPQLGAAITAGGRRRPQDRVIARELADLLAEDRPGS